MHYNIIASLQKLGVDVKEIYGESGFAFHNRMTSQCNNEYLIAKQNTAPSEKQIKLMYDLVDCGAPFELNEPQNDSIANADAFIKKHYHLLKNPTSTSVRATTKKTRTKRFAGMSGRLGGIGSERHEDFYRRNTPSDFNIPNH
jgi:hypothetical protein